MYKRIINPETGRKILVNGKKGREIIGNYLNLLKLSSSGGKFMIKSADINVNNVYYISYNAIVSGSVELRSLNKHYLFPLLKAEQGGAFVTKIGTYAYMYDNPQGGGGKLDEPNYDGLTACIALLDDKTFNSSFIYKKVKLYSTKGKWGNNNFLTEHETSASPLCKFCMIPEKIVKDRTLFSAKNYATDYKHIFILGPLSEQSYISITDIMSTATLAKPVIIHYQGESHLAERDANKLIVYPPRLKDTDGGDIGASSKYKAFYGLTPKGGLFANSFNWVGGMGYGLKLRDALERCSNCYTVCVRNRTRSVSNAVIKKIKELDSRKNLFSEMKLPLIYKHINDYIFNTVYTTFGDTKFDSKLLNFSDITVIQDLYDKDNSTAIDILAKKSATNINLVLVGRECGKIMYNQPRRAPVEAKTVNRRVTELCDGITDSDGNIAKCVPPYIKPNDFPSGMFFKLLNFGPASSETPEYWPDFTNSLLSQELDNKRTKNENIIMTKALLHLLSPAAQKKITYIGDIDNRAENTIALAGTRALPCFPFNELLFVPGLLYALDVILNTNIYSKKSISEINTFEPKGEYEILSIPADITQV